MGNSLAGAASAPVPRFGRRRTTPRRRPPSRCCETGGMPVGSITRGTTNSNRLRRVDRWIGEQAALRHAADPFVVDLGYGASGVTTFELAARLTRTRPDVEVLGLEIDPTRVRTAREQLERIREGDGHFPADLPVAFGLGGFEVPTPGGRRP